MAVKKDKERAVAKDLYIHHLWTAKDIAASFGISETTIGKWKSEDPEGNWDTQREAVISNPIKLKQLVQAEMVSIAQGNPPKMNADALNKLYKVVEGLGDSIHPGLVAAIIQLQDDFILKENPKLALELLEVNRKFLIHVINTYG